MVFDKIGSYTVAYRHIWDASSSNCFLLAATLHGKGALVSEKLRGYEEIG